MGFLQCSLCCKHTQQDQPEQPHSNNHHHLQSESSTSTYSSLSSRPSLPLQSESSTSSSLSSQPSLPLQSESSTSTSSSLSSQPSLPSVPSLTFQPSHQHQNHKLLTTIKGHTTPITSLALHTKFLYSGSSNSEIRRCHKDPFAHQSSNNTNNVVAITKESTIKSMLIHNNMMFTSHQDHKIRFWNIETNEQNSNQTFIKCIATLPTFNDRFSKLFSSKNYVEIRRHKKCTWVNHVDTVSSLALSKDGSLLLYSASWDRTFKIWRISDFKCLESVKDAHEDAINAIVVSSDGMVYTGSADRKIKMWKEKHDDKKHSLFGTLEMHKSAVNALALNEDGSVLYSGACDRSILVWEKKNGDGGDFDMVLVGALRGHSKAILCLVVMGDLVCSGSADYSVRVWRRGFEKGYSCLAVLVGHTRPVKCLAMAEEESNNGGSGDNSCNSYLVYSGSLDCDIKVWQIRVPLL